jgi:hypothetical protein
MQPRWQQLPAGDHVSLGELFPVDLTRVHPLRVSSSEIEKGRANVGDAMLASDWPRTVSPVKSGPQRDDLMTSILLQDGLSSDLEERLDSSRDASQLYSVVDNRQMEPEEYPEQYDELYDDTDIRRRSGDTGST